MDFLSFHFYYHGFRYILFFKYILIYIYIYIASDW